jgi:hypothetical protein
MEKKTSVMKSDGVYSGPVCQHNILRLNSWVGQDGI